MSVRDQLGQSTALRQPSDLRDQPAPRVAILGIRGIPASHGGFETFAERLALHLCSQGWEVTVYCQGASSNRIETSTWQGVHLVHIPVRLNGIAGTIEFDIKSTADAIKKHNRILTLGYNTGFLSVWMRIRNRTNFINMDGLEWKRAKYSFGAKAYLWVNERLAAAAGNCLIADHPAIADHLATRVPRSKIHTIPYGSDAVLSADSALLSKLGLQAEGFISIIARPEPENSVLEIVSAFSAKRRGLKLAVLGKYSRASAYQAKILDSASDEVVFTGAIYDQPIVRAIRFYSLAYAHGHQVGGTNPSLVEALGAGNAVIAHDNRFNRWVAGDSAAYFSDASSCQDCISSVLSDRERRERMKLAARERWNTHFTWDSVLDSYRTLLETEV
jgi:glycosyltransferase involved in cell wall biosynthesis